MQVQPDAESCTCAGSGGLGAVSYWFVKLYGPKGSDVVKTHEKITALYSDIRNQFYFQSHSLYFPGTHLTTH
jgi:uncharacterized protein YqkB